MTTPDLIATFLCFLGLAAIVGWCLRSAYRRANPKRRVGALTDWRDGRNG